MMYFYLWLWVFTYIWSHVMDVSRKNNLGYKVSQITLNQPYNAKSRERIYTKFNYTSAVARQSAVPCPVTLHILRDMPSH